MPKLCLAVLSSTLDLLDLSEPGDRRNSKDRKSPLSLLTNSHKNNSNRKNMDETELIQVEVEHTGPIRTPERASLDSGRDRELGLVHDFNFQYQYLQKYRNLRSSMFTQEMGQLKVANQQPECDDKNSSYVGCRDKWNDLFLPSITGKANPIHC